VGEQMAERTLDFLRVHARPVDHETE